MNDPKAPSSGGYDADYFAKLAEVEDRHFWFVARNRVIENAVHQLVKNLSPGYRVLEMGCGTGNVLRALEEACADGQVVGADLFDEGLSVARQRVRCALVQTDVRAFAFDEPFDVVGVFDVIEHLEDDRAVLRDLYRATKPGGGLLVTVPAYPALWSYFDEAAKHCRRYRPTELREKLTGAGFTVQYLSPFMSVLAPLVWLGRKSNNNPERSHAQRIEKELAIRPGVNGLLKALLALERPLLRRHIRLPIGSSLLAIARRPGDTAC